MDKRVLFVAALFTIFGVFASAEDPVTSAQRTLQRQAQVLSERVEALSLQDPATIDGRVLNLASTQVREAIQLLNTQLVQNPKPPQQPAPVYNRLELVCMPRDNDGRAPFIMAIRNPDLSVIRFPQIVSQSLNDCQTQIGHVIPVGRESSLMCGSRDGDGRTPFSLFALKRGSLIPLGAVSPDLAGCYTALSSARNDGYSIRTCMSRDNDGRSPFIMVRYGDNGQFNKSAETFSNFNDCIAAQ